MYLNDSFSKGRRIYCKRSPFVIGPKSSIFAVSAQRLTKCMHQTRPRGYKTFFMLLNAYKYKKIKKFGFLSSGKP